MEGLLTACAACPSKHSSYCLQVHRCHQVMTAANCCHSSVTPAMLHITPAGASTTAAVAVAALLQLLKAAHCLKLVTEVCGLRVSVWPSRYPVRRSTPDRSLIAALPLRHRLSDTWLLLSSWGGTKTDSSS